ncbi:MAG TPA: hypothetical protein VGK67_16930 [Myxococcales bacterium]|jgi:hypothetical protein
MRARKLLGAAAVAVVLLGASSALAREELKSQNPWRDTSIDYGHVFSATSLSKKAEPTYNPYYAQQLVITPVWHLWDDYLVAKVRLAMEQELTNSDDTTYQNQVMLSDLQVDLGTSGVTEGFTGIKISGGVRFYLPTSLAARATTMYLAVGPGLALSRKIPILQGLTIGYSGRFNFAFHKFTSMQNDATSIACGAYDGPSCGQFVQTGLRNAWGQLVHGPRITLGIIEGLTFDVSFTWIKSYLYPLAATDYAPDRQSGFQRQAQAFEGSLSYDATDFLSIGLGFSSLYGDLAPDGKWRMPFNRLTQISLGISVAIDPIVSKFQ